MNSLPTRLLSTLGLAAILAAGTSGLATADTLNIRYGISLIGLPIGTAGLQVHVGNGAYDLRVDTKLTGLAALVSSAKGAATASGAYNQTKVAPSTYATTSANAQITRTIRMALNGGNVRAVDIYPPFEDPPDRVPLTEANKHNVVDPVSAFVMPVKAHDPLVGAAACDRTLPVFDGYTRFDVSLAFAGTREVKTKGYSGPVTVCTARFTPIAGHRPDRPATKFMEENRDLEAWLLPVESAHVVLPYRISVRTMVGTTIIEAQDLQIDKSAAKPGATPVALPGDEAK